MGLFGKLMGKGSALYRKTFKQTLPTVVLISALQMLPSMLHGSIAAGGMNHVSILPSLISILGYFALLIQIRHPNALGLIRTLKIVLQRVIVLLVAYLLYGLACVLGTLALVIPGIYLSVSLGLFAVTLADAPCSPITALKHSMKRVDGHWGLTALMMFTAAFLQYFAMIAGAILFVLANLTPHISIALILVLGLITLPWSAAVISETWDHLGQQAQEETTA